MKSFSFPLFNSFGKIWWKEIQEECIEWDDRLWDAKNTNDLRRMGKNRKLFWGRAVQILRKISHSIWWEGNSGDFIFLSKESVSSVQSSHSVVSDSLRPYGLQHARPPCLSPTPGVYSNSCSSSRWYHPTISSSVVPFSSHLQSFPSVRVFSNELVLGIRWPKYWSFSFIISPSNEHPGLICFRMDWLDLLVVQGTLKSLVQHHNSKASILRCSAFLIVHLSHPYMTTGKTIALTRWTFVGKE